MARLIDVTVPLSKHLPAFPGDPRFEIEATERIANGAPYNLSRLTLGTHAGTHVDAPFHFEANGATVDQLPLDVLMGRARVVDLGNRECVDRAFLAALDLGGTRRLLFKTRTSGCLVSGEMPTDFAYLTPDAASHLVEAGIELVGIDSPSVERFGSSDYTVHHTLLRAGVVIVESLDLSNVTPGEYDFTCLPLRVAGADGAPARAVLRTLS
jgi:arylformamidase